jgi:hypothetical protein
MPRDPVANKTAETNQPLHNAMLIEARRWRSYPKIEAGFPYPLPSCPKAGQGLHASVTGREAFEATTTAGII